MTKHEAQFKQGRQVVKRPIGDDIRNTSPEVRFRQLITMFESTDRRQPDPEREAAKAEVRERWRLLKERFHASI